VVLFITDGVSNYFLNTTAGNLSGGKSLATVSGGPPTTYKSGSDCDKLGELVVENAVCQTTEGAMIKTPQGVVTYDGKYNGMDRPITQMINVSSNDLRNTTINASVFVIALSSIPSTGLDGGVSSSHDYFFSAPTLTSTTVNGVTKTNVDVITDTISTKVQNLTCTPGPSGSVAGTISPSQFLPGIPGMTYPQVGTVTITKGATSLTQPIYADMTTGMLTYSFTDLTQGTYSLSATLYYHHPLDPIGTMRTYSKIWTKGSSQDNVNVDVYPSTQGTSFSQRIEAPLSLKLNGSVCP